ncbi:TraV family lipoprotein [Sphingomonas sp. 2R-10]|uniref:TraV family lipoprotein n=1 Tax=Sphingomonas sp. 2R-10 TaxID=3045148 RepID=UPI000F76DB31|nr:TraV family lipoprotein [Sphingomonas sp. 2R-10]MDJ0277719.1 TraV family lipoprotein [Sphingomonas sp. 2R-10]
MSKSSRKSTALLLPLTLLPLLGGCASLGHTLSPYAENFSCKNSDHGQCIAPDKAYADAVAGRAPRSDPAVTRDKALLGEAPVEPARQRPRKVGDPAVATAYQGYRDSVYRELQGLVDRPVTPMLRPGRTVRTLILPYADRERPDRLYMPRYVYSVLDAPQWVVGDYLVNPVSPAARAPVLGQVRDKAIDDAAPMPVAPGTGDDK